MDSFELGVDEVEDEGRGVGVLGELDLGGDEGVEREGLVVLELVGQSEVVVGLGFLL